MSDNEEAETVSFESFFLDDRLIKAIAALEWTEATLVQASLIPLALEGKHIITKARTGSGKTAAFLIPIIQKILERKNSERASRAQVHALVMAPTKELCQQIATHTAQLCQFCSREVRCVDLSQYTDTNTERSVLSNQPEIVISTPSRVVPHMTDSSLLQSIQFLVIDEADLLYSFGYERDVKAIVKSLPRGTYQTLLTSATMSDDVHALKKQLRIRSAVTLKLQDGQLPPAAQLTQYHVRLTEEDKFVLLCALLKLKVLTGKTIIFVKDTDRCYQLRLFLSQFGVNSCVLNAEMPANSRIHIVTQFNDGLYSLVIASDDTTLVESRAPDPPAVAVPDPEPDAQAEPASNEQEDKPVKKQKKRKRDAESGVARGVDFNRVANVLNFDFPISVDDYVHRVGRTARGNNRGTALSFVTEKDEHVLDQVQTVLSTQLGCGDALRKYEFQMSELDGFRYRARDVLRSVTGTAVREARLAEIRAELLKCKKLQSYFAQNPNELDTLRHDTQRHTLKRQPHLQHVPDYLVPAALKNATSVFDEPAAKKQKQGAWKKPNNAKSQLNAKARHKFLQKKSNPLRSKLGTDSADF